MNPRHPSYGPPDRPDAFVAWACQCRCHKNTAAQAPVSARPGAAATAVTPGGGAPLPPSPGTIYQDDDLWDDDLWDDDPDNDWPFVLMVSLAWLVFALLLIVAVAS